MVLFMGVERDRYIVCTFSGFEFSFASGTAACSGVASIVFELVRGAKKEAIFFCDMAGSTADHDFEDSAVEEA